jgi:hypothetical protein
MRTRFRKSAEIVPPDALLRAALSRPDAQTSML